MYAQGRQALIDARRPGAKTFAAAPFLHTRGRTKVRPDRRDELKGVNRTRQPPERSFRQTDIVVSSVDVAADPWSLNVRMVSS